MDTKQARLIVGRGAVLSVSKAVELLPLRDADARAAIEAAGIVKRIGDKRVLVWGELLDALLVAESANVEPAKPAKTARLPRVKLN